MESKTEGVVVGLDGGGTHTLVMVADLAGSVLSYTEKGASSIYKDSQWDYLYLINCFCQ